MEAAEKPARDRTETKQHLLVVDDSDGVRETLAIRLRRDGFDVSLAANAAEALVLVDDTHVDLILLDIRLPDMDGLELLVRLRRRHSPLDVPIIVISGLDDAADVVTALRQGANDYLTKPFDLNIVLARVTTQLSLKQLTEANQRFLRIAGHDLKKPVMLMLDVARQLKAARPPGASVTAEDHAALSMLIDSAEFMQHIIEDLLELHAVRAGRLHVVKRPTDIGALVRQAVAHNSSYAQSKNIGLAMQFDNDLPRVRADDARIMQVLENLIGNAIKFSPAGARVTVTTRREAGYLRCEIADTGPGIADEDMKKLFVEYAQLRNLPTGHEKSTGLGLSICCELIHLHDGDIGAHNNPDGGATFWFRLPLS